MDENADVGELHYIRHRRVAAMPFLKRLETGSVLKGSRPIRSTRETEKLIERRRSESNELAIDWSVRSSASESISSADSVRIIELLDDATDLAASLDLLPNDRAKIVVVFTGSDVLLNVSRVSFYIRKPAFTFYFPQEEGVEESLLTALPVVMHELVHYRTAFDNRYRDSTAPILSEEVTAYAAGQCASVWLSRRGGYVMSIRRAAVPSREMLLEDYQKYGEGHAGRLLADSLVFPAYPEVEEHDVKPADISGIIERCSELVRVGRGVDLQFIGERPLLRVLR